MLHISRYIPELHVLDNEFSGKMKKVFLRNNFKLQRVPPRIHRRNASKKTIQTLKDYFLVSITMCDPYFLIIEWCILTGQADITLNLLQLSGYYPNLVDDMRIYSMFDFNATPFTKYPCNGT